MGQTILDVSVSFLNYRNCTCEDSFYWHLGLQQCLPCSSLPNLSKFSTCASSIHHAIHSINGNYQPVLFENGMRVTAKLAQLYVYASLPQCYAPNACNVAPSQPQFECDSGRDVDSLLCSRCLPGYFATGLHCYLCKPSYATAVPLSIFVIFVLGLIYLWTASSSSYASDRSEASSMIGNTHHSRWSIVSKHGAPVLSMFLFFLQLNAVFNRINDNSTQAAAFNDWLQTVSTFRPWGLECVNSAVDFYVTSWIILLSPFLLTAIIFAIFGCLHCIARIIRKCQHTNSHGPRQTWCQRVWFAFGSLNWSYRTWYIVAFFLKLAYFPVLVRTLALLSCDQLA